MRQFPLYHERQAQLRKPVARLIRKLALTSGEIKALPDNYTAAARANSLPDLFGPGSEWLEILWFPNREHDRAAHQRRAARVFIKPAKKPEDKLKFVQRAQSGDITPEIAAAVLLVQNLLVDSAGEVVVSPLTYAMQMRDMETPGVRFVEYELGRTRF
jgi:hypothetical protein